MAHRYNWYRENSRLTDFGNYLFYKENNDKDFTFLVSGRKFPVHKLMVKHSSDVFRSKFEEWEALNLKEVTLDVEVASKSFQTFLQYIYTGSINYKDIDDKTALDLLKLTDKFGFWVLASEICTSMDSKDYINIWNVWSFYIASDNYHLQALHDSCLKFIDTHAIETLNEKSCHEVSAKLFKNVLSRDTLFARELEIVKSAMKWLQINEKCDEDLKKEIFGTIRWSLITSTEWDEVIKPMNLFDDQSYRNAIHEKKETERINSLIPRQTF